MTDHDTELAREITEKGLEEYSSSWKKANKKGDAGRPFRECMSEAITQALRSVRQEAEKKVIKEIEEGTRKVFGDGTKGPWKTLLGKVRQDENEACAKVAETTFCSTKYDGVVVEIATAIRKRIEEKP